MTRAIANVGQTVWDLPVWAALMAAPFAFLAGGVLRGLVGL